MLPFIKEKKDCTGCTACYSSCPLKCISMNEDEEGFLYPTASDKCINCGLCQRVCPQLKNNSIGNDGIVQVAFAGVTRDNEVWRRSASGGAFSEICLAWGDDSTMFVGAAWEGLQVKHQCVIGIQNIGVLCKSKYIESSLCDVFSSVKNHLDQGSKALFCGTPCQVAGLKSYLKKDYSNLLLIDLICHGVGSPKVFSYCMEVLGDQFGRKIESYEFRAKKSVYEKDHIQKIKANGLEYVYLENDPYIQLFLRQDCLRASCGRNCKYRNENREGDITIADYKGLQTVFPELIGVKKNYSSIIVNTSKGASVVPQLNRSMKLLESNLEDIKNHNPLFYRNTWNSESRDQFFDEFRGSPKETIERRTRPAVIHKMSKKKVIYNLMPTFVRKLMIRLYSKIGGVI